MRNRLRHALAGAGKAARAPAAALVLGLLVHTQALAAPGTVLYSDNFNNNGNSLRDWTIVSNGGDASLGTETSNSGNRSLRLRWGPVSIASPAIPAAVPAARLDVWIRRGDDSFSEAPDSGEDLIVEYLSASGVWTQLDRFYGSGTPGEIYTPSYDLPADALTANLSIRFELTSGSGIDYDYWHVDDLVVTETAPAAPPFGVGSCEDFESGLGNWSVSASGGDAGTSSATYNSPGNSLYTRWGAVSVASNPIDLSGETLVSLSVWIRRGGNFAGSEKPDNGEDLAVEYLSSSNAWVTLETLPGGGTGGEVFTPSYGLPADALHAGFRVRFRQTGGSGSDYDYWHVDDVCLSSARPVSYSFEENQWTGAAGEVKDGSGAGVDGTVVGGAQNAQTTPALAGNPGTCRYGDFDGQNDYVEVPDNSALDVPDEVTVAAWIYARSAPPGGDLKTIVSKDWNYEYHLNASRQVYWWWNDSTGAVRTLTTPGSLSLNRWHHIAVTYRSGSQTIYVDGTPWATSSYTGTLRQNSESLYIGTDLNFFSSRNFDGYIDEVYVIPEALSQSEVQTLMNARHPCATAAAEFTINHDGFGINCVPETITVDVIDSNAGTPRNDYNAGVTLDTGSGYGTWTLVSGGGTLVDSTPGDGLATYAWPLGESQAVFALSYPEGPPSINVDVYQTSDPGIRDTNAEGNLVFSPNGFTITATPLSNPPGAIVPFQAPQTAGADFPVYITAYGQRPDDPQCGVIESYTGPRNLKFWFAYVDPASGTRTFQIDGASVPPTETAAAAQAVTFTNGQAVVTAKYKDVGRARLLVKDDTRVDTELPGGIRGGTANFVVKPYDFQVGDIRDAAGAVANPQASSAAGPKFIGAGQPFRATVTAVDAEGDPTPNYGRETTPESVRLDVVLLAPAGGSSPPLTAPTGFGAFTGGTATGTDFAWNEVGIVRLEPGVLDGDYLGAGDVAGTASEPVGRFVPDHFDLAGDTPEFATACGMGGFTYEGQAFQYQVAPSATATARSAAGVLTRNYTGAFFKLATATLQNRAYTAATGTLDESGLPAASADPAVAQTSPGVATLTFSSGSGLAFARSTPTAPFQADIELSIVVRDADGVAAASPLVFGAGGGIAFSSGAEMRYGRVRIANAVGSELVNLPVTAVTEYYSGPATGFVKNGADSCTSGVALAFSGFTKSLAPGETCALDAGAPGSSGVGCAAAAPSGERFAEPPLAGDFNLRLAAPGAGNEGGLLIGASVPAWLRFDWNAATPGDEDPAGQVTFGIYGGDSHQIYLREVY